MTDLSEHDRIARAVVRVEVDKLPYIGAAKAFTKSNGTIMARIYERLTKASRRRQPTLDDAVKYGWALPTKEIAYRQGVYDALKAVQQELV